ncbi:MAG: 23S rRNA (pseudouridine(1915)-N(3))-methyltransferase RlmH [Chitinophagales bacterium]|nr:23S rRNA (pseudouridine(1915)-N(3))-methyltransferase RlmH [Chitinophagales bacterium]
MKIKLITISKNESAAVEELFTDYTKRLKHYTTLEIIQLKPSSLKDEATAILKKLSSDDELILLDEKGKEFTTVAFSSFLQKKMNASRNLCFVIGSAYGFDDDLKKKSSTLISLSKMTLPHLLAKVIFAEQLYRAFTVLKNEKYHH